MSIGIGSDVYLGLGLRVSNKTLIEILVAGLDQGP